MPAALSCRLLGLILVAMTVTFPVSVSNAETLGPEKLHSINIPPMDAANALNMLAEQADVFLLFSYRDAKSRRANSVTGQYTLVEALGLLLENTGLASGFSDNGAIKITVVDGGRIRKIEEKKALKKSKKGLLATIIGIFTASGGAAHAQTPVNEEDLLEEITVVGIRYTLEQNLAIKRNSEAFVDAITSEDIGKFPDKNVADALQRVPGVSISRSGGEGQFVSVRGTSSELTLTLLNGNYVATASTSRDPLRSFNFSLLPANLVQRTEVYKSPQANIDEGGVGGTIIIHTRRPFDMDAGTGFLNFEETYADVTGKMEPQYSGLYSWKNAEENFGVLVSYVSQERTVVGESISTENWTLFDDSRADEPGAQASLRDTAGNEITGYAPFAVVQSRDKQSRDREGLQVTLQWAPTDNIETTFNYIGSRMEQNNDQDLVLVAEWDYRDPAIVPGSVRKRGDTIVAMQLADGDLSDDTVDLQAPAVGSRRSLSESESDTYDFELTYSGESYRASVNFGHTKSSGGTSFNNLQRFFSAGGRTSSYGWDLGADTILNYDAEQTDFTGFGWRSTDAGTSSDEESYFQADLSFDYELGIFESFEAGAKYRDHAIERRLNNLVWDDGDPNNATLWGGCCGLGFEYWHTDVNIPSAEQIPTFLRRVKGLTGEANTQTSFFAVNWDAYIDWLDANFTRSRRDDNGFFYNVDEEITAAYIQGNYKSGDFSGNIGLRAVRTEQSAETFDAPLGIRDEELDISDGSYTDLLPSFNFKWNVSEDLVVRAAASRVVARVDYGSLGASEGFNAPAEGSDTTTGSRGNPDLEPYDSTQFDVGVEWYFAPASMAGVTVFRKKIDSFVTTSQVTEQRTVPGRTEPVNVVFSLPVNGTDVTSEGVELYYQHAFDFGGGIIANYTYTDNSLATLTTDGAKRRIPLPGSSEHQYNLSAYYESDNYSVRASYNYRDDYAGEQSNGGTVYTDGYGQVDLNASYGFTDALVLNASVINLTKETIERYWVTEDRLYGRAYSGRRFYLGLNYKF